MTSCNCKSGGCLSCSMGRGAARCGAGAGARKPPGRGSPCGVGLPLDFFDSGGRRWRFLSLGMRFANDSGQRAQRKLGNRNVQNNVGWCCAGRVAQVVWQVAVRRAVPAHRIFADCVAGAASRGAVAKTEKRAIRRSSRMQPAQNRRGFGTRAKRDDRCRLRPLARHL